MTRTWTEAELGEALLARANARKNTVLSPQTAMFVGLKLLTASKKPTRDEVARLLCSSKCQELCYSCKGTANKVVQVYGERAISGSSR